MDKGKLDLGKSGANWEKNHLENLSKAIKEIYGEHIPPYLTGEEVYYELLDNYDLEGDLPRQRDGLSTKVSQLYLVKERFHGPIRYGDDLRILCEWSSIRCLSKVLRNKKKVFEAKDIEFLEKKGLIYDSHIICKIGLHENQDRCYFIYPRNPYADYSMLFKSIHSIKREDLSNDESMKVVETTRAGLFNVGHETQITITYKEDEKDHSVVQSCAHYLLDYLLGFLAAKVNTPGFDKEKRGGGKSLINAINVLPEKLSYNCSLKEELLKYEDIDITDQKGNNYLGLVSKIAETADEKGFSIPTYSIWMSRSFELYTLSALNKVIKGYKPGRVTYQMSQTTQDNKNAKPDIVYTTENECYIIDAKYKYDYRIRDWFSAGDLDRMVKYVVSRKDEKEKEIKARFVFPKDREKTPEEKYEYLDKIALPLPKRKE